MKNPWFYSKGKTISSKLSIPLIVSAKNHEIANEMPHSVTYDLKQQRHEGSAIFSKHIDMDI